MMRLPGSWGGGWFQLQASSPSHGTIAVPPSFSSPRGASPPLGVVAGGEVSVKGWEGATDLTLKLAPVQEEGKGNGGEREGEGEGGGASVSWWARVLGIHGRGGAWGDDVMGGGGDDDTLHVFTVASGHLYERLASIMMLSVVRHTRGPVQFHVIGNFVSPRWKSHLPTLKKSLGIHVTLHHVHWPPWLLVSGEREEEKEKGREGIGNFEGRGTRMREGLTRVTRVRDPPPFPSPFPFLLPFLLPFLFPFLLPFLLPFPLPFPPHLSLLSLSHSLCLSPFFSISLLFLCVAANREAAHRVGHEDFVAGRHLPSANHTRGIRGRR